MGFLLSKLLPLLVYPLGLGLLLQLAGLGSGRKAKLSRALGASGIAMVWLFAMPVTSRQLIWGLEERAAALKAETKRRVDAKTPGGCRGENASSSLCTPARLSLQARAVKARRL